MKRVATLGWGLGALAIALLASVLFAGVPLAHAQAAPREGFRLDRYAAPPTSRDGFVLTLPDVSPHLTPAAYALARYAHDPLSLRTPEERTIIDHQLALDVVGALGLFGWAELYTRLPLVLATRGGEAALDLTDFRPPSGANVGDMALGLTGRVLERRGFVLGARVEALLPSGSRSNLTSDGSVEPLGELLASYERGRMTFAVMGGGLYRPARDYASARIGPELRWGGAVRVRIDHALEALVEAVGVNGLRERASPGASDGLELSVGARRRITSDAVSVSIGGALGAGLSELLGEPALRAVGQISIEREPGTKTDELDSAERYPDGDDDGVPDAQDDCLDDDEDRDGFDDGDGCPELDNDGDGVADAQDACPNVEGAGKNGCPTDDLDEDGVPDARDPCPRDAEDVDGDRDEDGCPDRDSDGDGLTDDRDACPDVPGLAEQQGCLAHAKLERDRIVLLSPIVFDDQNVWITPASRPVLDDVAALLRARPKLAAELIVVVSARPTADRGETLASARLGLLLQALVAREIPRERLHGSTRIASEPNATDVVEILLRVAAPPGREAGSPPASAP